MGWASTHIARLKAGETVSFRPKGTSMSGRVEDGQLVTVDPVDPAALEVGDVVLCSVNGRQYLHLIKAIRKGQFQIGNNRNLVNGWTAAKNVYGRLVAVQD